MPTGYERKAARGVAGSAGLVPAADYLRALLNNEARYRGRWRAHARRRGGSPNVDAVSTVLVTYQWANPADVSPRDTRSMRDRVARALAAHTFTPTTAQLFADAFDFKPEHRTALLDHLTLTPPTPTNPVGPRSSTPRHQTLSIHELHVVGPDRRPISHRTVHTLRALVDGVDRYHYAFDTDQAVVRAVGGATTNGELLPHPTVAGYWQCALTFHPPMRRDEVRVFEYSTALAYDSPPAPELRRAVNPMLQSVSMRVEFSPSCLPRSVTWCSWSKADEPPVTVEHMELDELCSIARFVERTGTELIGFTWCFDQESTARSA